MTLPFTSPISLPLVCSAGLFAASGVLYVKAALQKRPREGGSSPPINADRCTKPVAKTTFTTARKSIARSRLSREPDAPCFRRCFMGSTTSGRTWFRPSSGRGITPRCRAMPLVYRRGTTNRGTPASNRWSLLPQLMAAESARCKTRRCVLSPATGCDGCGAAASARSTKPVR